MNEKENINYKIIKVNKCKRITSPRNETVNARNEHLGQTHHNNNINKMSNLLLSKRRDHLVLVSLWLLNRFSFFFFVH